MSSEVAPALNHPDRILYEKAYRSGNHVLQTSLSLDASVHKLQDYARRHPNPTSLDFKANIQKMTQQTQEALDKVHESGGGSWNEYYRLVSQAAFLELSILTPFIFEDPQDFNTRNRLINGVYGISGVIIDQELSELEVQQNSQQCSQLRGAIHEQTVTALLNRQESKRRLALPSRTSDDLLRRVDINYWRRPDHADTHEYIPIQVKWSLRENQSERKVAPRHGVVITAADFNNSNFETSHLIVKELGLRQQDPITDDERAFLDEAEQQLITTIDQKIYNIVA